MGLFGKKKPAMQSIPGFPSMDSIPTTAGGQYGNPLPDAQPKERGGFFKPYGAGQMILSALSDLGASMNDQQGGALQGFMDAKMAPMREAAALAAEQRKRAAELADYGAKKQIDQQYATPEKDAFDRALVNAGIDPQGEQGVGLYRQRAMTMAQGQPQEPRMIQLPDGRSIFGTMDEIRTILGGGQQQPQRPARPVGGLTPLTGGTGGSVGGGFRP